MLAFVTCTFAEAKMIPEVGKSFGELDSCPLELRNGGGVVLNDLERWK